ncbi:MAG: cytochrome C, partial [Acidobacteria bacterium]
TCHGPVDKMPTVYEENTLQMEWCIQCHREPEKFIRPKSEVFNMSYRPEDTDQAERDQLKVDYKIRSREMLTSCSTCHR